MGTLGSRDNKSVPLLGLYTGTKMLGEVLTGYRWPVTC